MPGPRAASPVPPSAWANDRGGHLWARDREVVRDDGTRVRYVVRGPAGAPVIACIAGFLCPDNFWRDIAPPLIEDHRVVLLSYRGVGASTEAGGDELPTHPDDYTIEQLAGDVAAVLDAEGFDQVIALGHSMGVQVALQLWRARPDLVGALALVAGTPGSPFETMYDGRVGSYLFPVVSVVGAALPRAVTSQLMRLIESPAALPAAKALRAVGRHTPWEGMTPYRAHLARVDPRTAIWTSRGMAGYDATDWLDQIDVPTTVVVGTHDGWCPTTGGQALAAKIPESEIEVIEGASHTLPIEFPDVVVRHVRQLGERLGESLRGPSPSGASASEPAAPAASSPRKAQY